MDTIKEPIEPNSDVNNDARIRARAEDVAKRFEQDQPTPLEIGYMVVFLSLHEAANQVRYLAGRDLTPERLCQAADQLDALAEHTISLGEAHTEGRS